MSSRLRVSLHAGWMAAALLVAICLGGLAQGNRPAPPMAPGELIIGVRHGTPLTDVQALAASVKATIVKSFGPIGFQATEDAYHLKLPNAPADADTLNAAAALKQDPRVMYAGPNYIMRLHQTSGGAQAIPNDPSFPLQWDKLQIRMPEAWTLEKGESNVIIAIVDSGVDVTHPEFQGRLLTGYNAFDGSTNVPDTIPHGTHVAGIAAAQANNGIGIAGNAWQNVMILPVKVFEGESTTNATIIAGLQYVQTQMTAMPNKSFVVNMSLGGDAPSATPDPTDPFYGQILSMATNGAVFSISAGNSFMAGNPPSSPAYLAPLSPNIMCVASSGRQRQHASYSEVQPYTTIAAPGGDDPDLIYSTFPVNMGSYGYEEGTSMAAPQITGVAALLLSVPGVKPTDVKGILTSTATPGQGQTLFPSPEFGAGIVDAYAALLKVAVSVTIQTPEGTHPGVGNGGQTPQPEETLQPTIRATIAQFQPSQIAITIDGSNTPIRQGTTQECTGDNVYLPGIADKKPFYCIENIRAYVTDTKGNQVLDPNGNPIPLIYDAVIRNAQLSPGQHAVTIIGTKPGTGNTTISKSDTVTFSIEPHVIDAGRSMISIPYYQLPAQVNSAGPITPEQYFGTAFRLARWVPGAERYAFYTASGAKDPAASFAPPTASNGTDISQPPHIDGDPTPRYPLGLGYWMDNESVKPVLTKGHPLTDKAFVIPLVGNGSGNANFISWNMIGDPFPFDVPFNSVLVDTSAGRMSIADAAAKGYIVPNIYTFDGVGGYTFATLPSGALRAWTAHWIGVTSADPNLALVVPPAGSGIGSRAATRSGSTAATRAASTPPATPGGWHLQIGAHVRDLHDTYNFIGISSRAADGYNPSDVAKPPMPSPYVSLGTLHTDWGNKSGLYMQDIQAAGGVKNWTLAVSTDQPDSDVTLTWSAGAIPRNIRLTLKDEATGQVVDMRSVGSVTFNTGADAATRKYTVTARTGATGPVRITNLVVRSAGRATGASIIGFNLSSDATYDVKVLNGAGIAVNTLATRAAATGDVNLVWNGRDANGRAVPSGTYLVQVRATTADGDSVRALMPFTVVR